MAEIYADFGTEEEKHVKTTRNLHTEPSYLSPKAISKPPKHPLQGLHLPVLVSPIVGTRKPRFSIVMSPHANNSLETSIGNICTSLTPNSTRVRSVRARNLNESSDSSEMTDIEKIINDQSYFSFEKTPKINLNKSANETQKIKIKIKTSRLVKKKKKFEIEKEKVELPALHYEKKEIIVPDIEKAPFGVHRAYNELDLQMNFRKVNVELKPREEKFKSRKLLSLSEQEERDRILSEILFEKRVKPE